jgi:phenylacetic acid degradation operon negative regulatory protein
MSERTLAAATALVARFRRQRPLRGGSLIITVFGDAIAPRGGAITLGSLIPLMQSFGLTERLVRTSVARLATDDWLASRRSGRLSEYRLSRSGRTRFLDATRRIYAGPATEWSGKWTLVLLPGLDTARRRRIREALHWEGFGEPEPGVLAHPTLTPAGTQAQLSALGLAETPIVLESRAGGRSADRRLLQAGWDLRELAARYARFIDGFTPVLAALARRSQPPPESAFIVRTLLIHEYRKIHLRDPLLPQSLLPRDWPGTAAYELCRSLYERVFPAAEAHLARVASRLDGPLPPPEASVYQRFAGLPRNPAD